MCHTIFSKKTFSSDTICHTSCVILISETNTGGFIWENFYSHYKSGCKLGACSVIFAIIVSIVHGALAMLSPYFIGVQIAFGAINLVYIIMKFYTICWICKIKAQISDNY